MVSNMTHQIKSTRPHEVQDPTKYKTPQKTHTTITNHLQMQTTWKYKIDFQQNQGEENK